MLRHDDLYSLEQYARLRPEFRARVIEHKKHRRLPLGAHAALYFEDALTMQYQVQEMLRIERIFEPAGIQDELDVYNALVPDGSNWKATFMIEYADAEERRVALGRLIGVERALWVQVADFDKVRPIANEDLDRETPDKTASVHFVRFEFSPPMIAAMKAGAPIRAGIDHPQCTVETEIAGSVRESLVADFS
ncbi:MAG TPA: DUF3501 family protein [Rhodocyclaceae bacterium]